MTLITQIKQDQVAARKARDTVVANALTTLIGEAEMVGKNAGRAVTDGEVQAVLKKFVDNIDFTLRQITDNEAISLLQVERAVYERYRPRQMNALELEKAVGGIRTEISAGPKDMGKIMAVLKTRFAGQYDGKMASDIIRNVLAA